MFFLFKIDLNKINECFEISRKMKRKLKFISETYISQWLIVKNYN